MSRLVVISDQESALGFQLAGVETAVADDGESAQAILTRHLSDESIGLIAINTALFERISAAARQRAEKSYHPVVVVLPAGGAVIGLRSRRDYLTEQIRRAIGFHITFAGDERKK